MKEPDYEVIKKDGAFELRRYPAHVAAQTSAAGGWEKAGQEGSSRLVRYAAGANKGRVKIPLSAPFVQQPAGKDSWIVSCAMPQGSKAETLPQPEDAQVCIRLVPAQTLAVVCFRGRWTRESFEDRLATLIEWAASQGLTAGGAPLWSRYDRPWSLWFLRRNEVLLPLKLLLGDASER